MDDFISREAVINITAETGAWETQNRVRELPGISLTKSILGKTVKEAISMINFRFKEK